MWWSRAVRNQAGDDEPSWTALQTALFQASAQLAVTLCAVLGRELHPHVGVRTRVLMRRTQRAWRTCTAELLETRGVAMGAQQRLQQLQQLFKQAQLAEQESVQRLSAAHEAELARVSATLSEREEVCVPCWLAREPH